MTDRSRPLDPPRPVPFALRCALLFGRSTSQIGWLFVLVGTFFAWMFLSKIDLGLTTYGASASGVVEQIAETDTSVNQEPVLAFSYRFVAPDGQEVTGVSYSTDRQASVGQRVRIELDPADPRTSRIEGMRRQPFGPFVLLVLLFPLVGLVLAIGGLRLGLRDLALVRTGRLGTGRVVEVALKGEDEGVKTFEVGLEHRLGGAPHRITMVTRRTDLTPGSERAILYVPTAPGLGVLLDELARCHVGATGLLVAESSPAAVLYLFLPLAAVAAVLVVPFL